jgi:hypothetical protein
LFQTVESFRTSKGCIIEELDDKYRREKIPQVDGELDVRCNGRVQGVGNVMAGKSVLASIEYAWKILLVICNNFGLLV